MFATGTGDDDVAGLGPDAGVPARNEEGITGAADRPFELPREAESVAFGDPPRRMDVLAGAVLAALAHCFAGHRAEAVDALPGDGRLVGHRRY